MVIPEVTILQVTGNFLSVLIPLFVILTSGDNPPKLSIALGATIDSKATSWWRESITWAVAKEMKIILVATK